MWISTFYQNSPNLITQLFTGGGSGGGGGGFGRGGGGARGRGGFGGGGGGGAFRKFDTGPPERVIPLGIFDYVCQEDLVCKVQIEDVPYFNAPIFLENKEQIGKIDEIFGNLRDYYVSIKLGDNMKASSLTPKQKVCLILKIVWLFWDVSGFCESKNCLLILLDFILSVIETEKYINNFIDLVKLCNKLQLFIDPGKLLPLHRFIPKPPAPKGPKKKVRL